MQPLLYPLKEKIKDNFSKQRKRIIYSENNREGTHVREGLKVDDSPTHTGNPMLYCVHGGKQAV